jgi:hypothetical protein
VKQRPSFERNPDLPVTICSAPGILIDECEEIDQNRRGLHVDSNLGRIRNIAGKKRAPKRKT